MKALILQHEEKTPPGSILQWLKERGIPYKVHFTQNGFAALASFDFLIICGGTMDVDQEMIFPWLVEEKLFIHKTIIDKKKILGICLGAQLLAEQLGGKVYKASQWETGWQKINLLDERKEMNVFQWHGYQFSVPTPAIIFAESEACPQQAFTFKDHIMACQFHPEATIDWIKQCAEKSDLPAQSPFTQNKEEILNSLAQQETMRSWFFHKLDCFFL